MILVVEIVSFGVSDGIVEDELSGLGDLLSTLGNGGVEIVRDWFLGDLGDEIGRDAPTLHGHDPVV